MTEPRETGMKEVITVAKKQKEKERKKEGR